MKDEGKHCTFWRCPTVYSCFGFVLQIMTDTPKCITSLTLKEYSGQDRQCWDTCPVFGQLWIIGGITFPVGRVPCKYGASHPFLRSESWDRHILHCLSKFNSTHTLFLHLSLLPFPSFPYNYCHSHLDSNLTLRREELQDLRPSPRDPRASWKRGGGQWNHPCQVINYKMGVLTNQTKLVTDPQLVTFKILADNTYICVSEWVTRRQQRLTTSETFRHFLCSGMGNQLILRW